MKITSSFSKPNADNQIVSNIELSIGDFTFPNSGWTDFVIIILNWWNRELIKQIQGRKIIGEYSFMDGPFYYESDFSKEGEVKLTFKERRPDGSETIFLATVGREDFINEIKRNTDFILKESREYQLGNSDLKQLQVSFKKLLSVSKANRG